MTINFADSESLDGPLELIGRRLQRLTAVGIIGLGEAAAQTPEGYIIEHPHPGRASRASSTGSSASSWSCKGSSSSPAGAG